MTNQEVWKGKSHWLWIACLIAGVFHLALRNLPTPLGDSLTAANQEPFEVWAPDSKKEKREKQDEDESKLTDQKETVLTLKTPEKKDLKDKPAEFFGEFHNRVEEQTQAHLKGRLRTAPPSANPLPKGEEGLAQLMPFGAGPQKFSDEIKEGRETVLNTDRVAYASFINRVAEDIRDIWSRHVYEAMETLGKKRKIDEDFFITRIQVTLNGEGEVSSVQILKRSGEDLIDAAPGKAFWDASQFPNPPTQLVQEDGFVRLPFEFILELKRSLLSVLPLRV